MLPSIPLYHASMLTISGVMFTLGPTRLFCPAEGTGIHIVPPSSPLIVLGPIAESLAVLLRCEIESRLHHLPD